MTKDEKIVQIVSKLCQEFKKIRMDQRITRAKLGKLSGLHRTTIGLIENEKRIPTIATCLKIAYALDVDLAEIIKVCCDTFNKNNYCVK